MVVKRPRRDHEFSGTVIIEPLNPSGGFDIAAVWDRSRDHFVRNGDIFIGWSSKSVIINALKQWNPTRYAALSWDYLPFVPGGNSGERRHHLRHRGADRRADQERRPRQPAP